MRIDTGDNPQQQQQDINAAVATPNHSRTPSPSSTASSQNSPSGTTAYYIRNNPRTSHATAFVELKAAIARLRLKKITDTREFATIEEVLERNLRFDYVKVEPLDLNLFDRDCFNSAQNGTASPLVTFVNSIASRIIQFFADREANPRRRNSHPHYTTNRVLAFLLKQLIEIKKQGAVNQDVIDRIEDLESVFSAIFNMREKLFPTTGGELGYTGQTHTLLADLTQSSFDDDNQRDHLNLLHVLKGKAQYEMQRQGLATKIRDVATRISNAMTFPVEALFYAFDAREPHANGLDIHNLPVGNPSTMQSVMRQLVDATTLTDNARLARIIEFFENGSRIQLPVEDIHSGIAPRVLAKNEQQALIALVYKYGLLILKLKMVANQLQQFAQCAELVGEYEVGKEVDLLYSCLIALKGYSLASAELKTVWGSIQVAAEAAVPARIKGTDSELTKQKDRNGKAAAKYAQLVNVFNAVDTTNAEVARHLTELTTIDLAEVERLSREMAQNAIKLADQFADDQVMAGFKRRVTEAVAKKPQPNPGEPDFPPTENAAPAADEQVEGQVAQSPRSPLSPTLAAQPAAVAEIPPIVKRQLFLKEQRNKIAAEFRRYFTTTSLPAGGGKRLTEEQANNYFADNDSPQYAVDPIVIELSSAQTQAENAAQVNVACSYIKFFDCAAAAINNLSRYNLFPTENEFYLNVVKMYAHLTFRSLRTQLSPELRALKIKQHHLHTLLQRIAELADDFSNKTKLITLLSGLLKAIDKLKPADQTTSAAHVLTKELELLRSWLSTLKQLAEVDCSAKNRITTHASVGNCVAQIDAQLSTALMQESSRTTRLADKVQPTMSWETLWQEGGVMRQLTQETAAQLNATQLHIEAKPRALSPEEEAEEAAEIAARAAVREAEAKAAAIAALTVVTFESSDLYQQQSETFKLVWQHAENLEKSSLEGGQNFAYTLFRGCEYYAKGAAKAAALKEKLLAFARQDVEKDLAKFLRSEANSTYTYGKSNTQLSLFAHRSRTVSFGESRTENLVPKM